MQLVCRLVCAVGCVGEGKCWYSFVLDKIQPSKKIGRANAILRNAQNSLVENERELGAIILALHLKDEFKQRTAEAERLRADLERTEETLVAAERLLGQLSGEQGRCVVIVFQHSKC